MVATVLIDLPTVRACRELVVQELRKCGHLGTTQCDYCDRVLAEYEASVRDAGSTPPSRPEGYDHADQLHIIRLLLSHMARRSPQFSGLAFYEGDARRMEEIRRAVFG